MGTGPALYPLGGGRHFRWRSVRRMFIVALAQITEVRQPVAGARCPRSSQRSYPSVAPLSPRVAIAGAFSEPEDVNSLSIIARKTSGMKLAVGAVVALALLLLLDLLFWRCLHASRIANTRQPQRSLSYWLIRNLPGT